MTIPRERLRLRAERGLHVTAVGGGVGGIGALGLALDVRHAEYLAAGGGLVFLIGLVLFSVPTIKAWRSGMIKF